MVGPRLNGAGYALSAVCRHCAVDSGRHWRDNAEATHCADTPDRQPARHPVGGVPRDDPRLAEWADALELERERVHESRHLLQMVSDHVADGGIVIWHDGSVVLTWPDGGISRRVTRTGDG